MWVLFRRSLWYQQAIDVESSHDSGTHLQTAWIEESTPAIARKSRRRTGEKQILGGGQKTKGKSNIKSNIYIYIYIISGKVQTNGLDHLLENYRYWREKEKRAPDKENRLIWRD